MQTLYTLPYTNLQLSGRSQKHLICKLIIAVDVVTPLVYAVSVLCGHLCIWSLCVSQFETEKVENQVLPTHHRSSEKGLFRHHDTMPIAKSLKSHTASVGLNSAFSFALDWSEVLCKTCLVFNTLICLFLIRHVHLTIKQMKRWKAKQCVLWTDIGVQSCYKPDTSPCFTMWLSPWNQQKSLCA